MYSLRRPGSPNSPPPIGPRRGQSVNQRVRLSPRYRLPRGNTTTAYGSRGRGYAKQMAKPVEESPGSSSSSRWVWNKRYHSTPPTSPAVKKALYRRDACYQYQDENAKPVITLCMLPLLVLAEVCSKLSLEDRETFKLISQKCLLADSLAWAMVNKINLIQCIKQLFPTRRFILQTSFAMRLEDQFRTVDDFGHKLSVASPYIRQMTSLSTVELCGCSQSLLKLIGLAKYWTAKTCYSSVATLKVQYCSVDRNTFAVLAALFPAVDWISLGLFAFFYHKHENADSMWSQDEANPEVVSEWSEQSRLCLGESAWSVQTNGQQCGKLSDAYIAAQLCRQQFTKVKFIQLTQF